MGDGIKQYVIFLMIIGILAFGFICCKNSNIYRAHESVFTFVFGSVGIILALLPLHWFGSLCERVTDIQKKLDEVQETLNEMRNKQQNAQKSDSSQDPYGSWKS